MVMMRESSIPGASARSRPRGSACDHQSWSPTHVRPMTDVMSRYAGAAAARKASISSFFMVNIARMTRSDFSGSGS